MSHMVEITPSQPLGWQGVAEALAAGGLAARLVATSPNLGLEVDRGDVSEIAHALDSWLHDRGFGLVPQVVDDEHIVLRPPAA
jgi:hypothetical protein